MRGRAKRLRPILTDAIQALLDNVDDATAGALIRWYGRQYDAMTDALEAADRDDATFEELRDAVRDAAQPDAPEGIPADLLGPALGVLRATASALILGDTRRSMAARAATRAMRLRRAAEAAETAATLHEEAAETVRAVADEIEADEGAACYDNSRNKHNKRNRPAASSPPRPHPTSFTTRTSKNQTTRARAKTRDAPASSSAWMVPWNESGHDPVDLALAVTRERDTPRARACWGAHLRRLGARRFCEAVHVFQVDAQTGRVDNLAAALNAKLTAMT